MLQGAAERLKIRDLCAAVASVLALLAVLHSGGTAAASSAALALLERLLPSAWYEHELPRCSS